MSERIFENVKLFVPYNNIDLIQMSLTFIFLIDAGQLSSIQWDSWSIQ